MGRCNANAVFAAVFPDYRQQKRFVAVVHIHFIPGLIFFADVKLRKARFLGLFDGMGHHFPFCLAFVQEFFIWLAKVIRFLHLIIIQLIYPVFPGHEQLLFELFRFCLF